jgi:hypothetical protein
MRMKNQILSNFNKFITMLKLHQCPYPHCKKDEFDRVNDVEKAECIWDTLQRTHEGTKLVKKAKRQLIDGQLDRFVMLDDEDPQEMYNWLKKLVNKVRAYGSRRWGDRRVIDRMLRAYVIKDTMVISFIQ